MIRTLEKLKHYREPFSVHSYSMHGVKEELASVQSRYQSIDILDTHDYGLALFLDGKIQSAGEDERIYHEALVHPALVTLDNPKNVLVIGGGEGATLREIYKHPSIEKVVMVELDEQVVKLSRRFLPAWNAGAFDDPRTQLVFDDGRAWLEKTDMRFDAVFLDLNEPVEEGPAYLLYTKEFYRLVSQRLNENGLLVTQAGPSHGSEAVCLASIIKTMDAVFPLSRATTVTVPSFILPWAMAVGSKGPDTHRFNEAEIDRRLEERGIRDLFWYDGQTHQGMFSVAKDVRRLLKHGGKLIEDSKPLYIQI